MLYHSVYKNELGGGKRGVKRGKGERGKRKRERGKREEGAGTREEEKEGKGREGTVSAHILHHQH
jgi:hypothetical protein